MAGLIGLLSPQRSSTTPAATRRRSATPTRSTSTLIEDARNALIEGIIAESEDETLMDRYLGGEDIDMDILVDDLETAVARGSFHPVLAACGADRARRWPSCSRC